MRRLVIPLLFILIVILTPAAVKAQADSSVIDTLGFYHSPITQLQGDTIELPIYLSTDSIVSAISMNFTFNYTILHPVLQFDAAYQKMVDSQLVDPFYNVPDSADYVAPGSGSDSGLWYIQVRLASSVAGTYSVVGPSSKGTILVPYNLNFRGTARFLLAPKPITSGSLPYIPPGERVVAYIKFVVDSLAAPFATSLLTIPRSSTDFQKTELAETWFVPGSGDTLFDTIWQCDVVDPSDQSCLDSSIARIDTLVNTDSLTVSVIPVRLEGSFIVDEPSTDTGGGGGGGDVNTLPVMGTLSPSTFDINVGELVSFSVSASDAEGGEVKIYANRTTSLPSNASLYPSNPIVGSSGSASGTFSFTPDINQGGKTFIFTFEAQDDSSAFATNTQTVVVNVAGLVQDVLFTTSAEGQSPEGGIPGLDGVMVPINIITEKTIYGIQFDMTYDANKFELDSIVPSDRIPSWVTYDNIGNNPGELKVVTFGLENDPMEVGSTSAVLYLAFTVDAYAPVGCTPLSIYNAIESVDPNPEVPSLDLESEGGVLCVDMVGDVNLNHQLEVDDLTGIVAYIIGNYNLSRRRFAIADIVPNDTVNVVDLVGVINRIFGFEAMARSLTASEEFADLNVMYDLVQPGMEGQATVEADMSADVAGVELEISYNPAAVAMLAPQAQNVGSDFTLRYKDDGNGRMKILLYSRRPWNSDGLIQAGLSDILKIPYVVRDNVPISGDLFKITQAAVSTGDAKGLSVRGVSEPTNLPDRLELYQNRPNPFNPTTDIDFAIDNSGPNGLENVELVVFNILGQKVKTLLDMPLPTGQYTMTWDGTDKSGNTVASGVYLYRLTVGEASQTKKMILLK